MTRTLRDPVYKIEVWDSTPALLYTFGNTSTSRNEVLQWQYKDILTDGVGYFSFVVPAFHGSPQAGNYKYYDIGLNYTVKIFHDYTTVPATANFIGKVYDISGVASKSGYLRIISGLSQGEVLLRRIKTNDQWVNDDTDVIVTELATDLGINHAADIGDQNDDPSITCESETYFDLLRKLSDNYIGGVTVKFDFCVDVDGHLHWKERPWRTAGVPTFTVDQDILDYKVSRSVKPIRNNITVYGQQGKIGVPGQDGRCEPSNKDLWTVDNIANWTDVSGSRSSDAAIFHIGANSLMLETEDFGAGDHHGECYRSIIPYSVGIGHGKYQTLNFWAYALNAVATQQVRLTGSNSANYFYATIPQAADWSLKQYQLGENQEYNVDTNPNAPWHKVGVVTWGTLCYIDFYIQHTVAYSIHADGLYFGHGRWRDTASDLVGAGSSGVLYDQRDLEVTDDTLRSDAECEQRSEALLYQMKDPPVQIEVTTPGDNNILIGDRVPMTIPAENISAASYDIFMVEHGMSDQGYLSKTTMVNSASIREPVEMSFSRSLANLKVQVRRIASDLRRIG